MRGCNFLQLTRTTVLMQGHLSSLPQLGRGSAIHNVLEGLADQVWRCSPMMRLVGN